MIRETFLCACINSFGEGGHPMATPATLDCFQFAYVVDCVLRALQSGKLSEAAQRMGRAYLAIREESKP